jgi:hypothetical protein
MIFFNLAGIPRRAPPAGHNFPAVAIGMVANLRIWTFGPKGGWFPRRFFHVKNHENTKKTYVATRVYKHHMSAHCVHIVSTYESVPLCV